MAPENRLNTPDPGETEIREAAEAIQKRIRTRPKIALILGSGLGGVAREVAGDKIPYHEVPHMPRSTVQGHAGEFCIGTLAGKPVAVMSGRFHYYEGYSLAHVTFPVRVLHEIGCPTLIVTNAAGGVNTAFNVGDLMLITDHINNLGANPLRGPNLEKLGPRFPDLSAAYDKDLGKIAQEVAARHQIQLRSGVYQANFGPTYESPAEIRAYRTWGADAVGMSTVPEVIVARHMSMRVLGLSCITNMAAGILPQPLSHAEVIETTERVKGAFRQLVLGILEKL